MTLNADKAPGPDKIPNRILKYCATEIAQILQGIFVQSLTSGNLATRKLAYCKYNIYFLKRG